MTFGLFVRFCKAIGVALVGILIAIVAGNIVAREFFSYAVVWANEVAVVLFVWIAFVGAGVSFAENARIRFTYLIEKLPARQFAFMELLVSVVGAVLIGGFLVTGAYVAWGHRNQTFASVQVSQLWQWASVPIGTFIALVGWIRHGHWSLNSSSARSDTKLAGT
ncbi:TRAP transporter small permease subunit [Ottowia sp.]|uniref:TRAP transporter small permease n=1 Tax=Ottowia sp. TaxID=1898956 RepID=UPI0025FC753B|nr:TRAP transporter small permease subunit [Ottowia sp.]MBK6616803.1 TRAP transporter small permease subunit [Ottowia sp.]